MVLECFGWGRPLEELSMEHKSHGDSGVGSLLLLGIVGESPQKSMIVVEPFGSQLNFPQHSYQQFNGTRLADARE